MKIVFNTLLFLVFAFFFFNIAGLEATNLTKAWAATASQTGFKK